METNPNPAIHNPAYATGGTPINPAPIVRPMPEIAINISPILLLLKCKVIMIYLNLYYKYYP